MKRTMDNDTSCTLVDDNNSGSPVKVRKVDSTTSPRAKSDDNEEGDSTVGCTENGSSKLHPLLDIEHVLENVLSYLPEKTFKTASLVSKTWLFATRKLMVKRMLFAFEEKLATEFLEDSTAAKDVCMKSEMNGINISLKLSMGQFNEGETKVISFTTAFSLIQKLVELNVVIADLHLQFCAKDTSEALVVICYLKTQLESLSINTDCSCCKNLTFPAEDDEEIQGSVDDSTDEEDLLFPNLKLLAGKYKEKNSSGPGHRASNDVWELFRKLLICSPNLEGLHCKFYPCHHHEMFDVLVKNPSALQNLKSLSYVHLNQDEFRVLLSRNLALNSLSMSLYAGFRFPALYPFLSSQGESLETLEIDFVSLPNVPEKFPCGMDLVKLKHLSMRKFFGCVHFVSHMPKLESLTLEDINLSVALQDEAGKYQYKSKLKSLKIIGGKGSTGRFLLPTVYNDIVAFFPELKILQMEYLTDSTLKIILAGLPNLEELNIPNGIYSDAIIGSRKSESRNENMLDQREVGGAGLEAKASCLADLKRLRKVFLHSPKITDGGIRGLLKCRELRSICIDSPMISDASLRLLSQNEDMQHLEFKNCYQLTSKGISQAKKLWGKGRSLVISNK